jgi:hypothetical protein
VEPTGFLPNWGSVKVMRLFESPQFVSTKERKALFQEKKGFAISFFLIAICNVSIARITTFLATTRFRMPFPLKILSGRSVKF